MTAGNESATSLDTCANTSAVHPSGEDPTANWSEFARYCDFLSAQMTSLDMKKMLTVNWWRMPEGNQSIDVDLPGYARQAKAEL